MFHSRRALALGPGPAIGSADGRSERARRRACGRGGLLPGAWAARSGPRRACGAEGFRINRRRPWPWAAALREAPRLSRTGRSRPAAASEWALVTTRIRTDAVSGVEKRLHAKPARGRRGPCSTPRGRWRWVELHRVWPSALAHVRPARRAAGTSREFEGEPGGQAAAKLLPLSRLPPKRRLRLRLANQAERIQALTDHARPIIPRNPNLDVS